jgi:two-component system, NarL family, sensor histidine kinase UhpB
MKKIILAIIFFSAANVHAQTKVIDSLLRVLPLQKGDTLELTTRIHLANEYLRRDLPKAKQIALGLIALADTHAKEKWLSGAYNYLININQQTGELDSALYYFKLSEALVKQNPDNLKMQYNFNQAAGLFYKNIGEYKQALPYMLENLRIWTKPDENRAGLLLNLGNLHNFMGSYKNASDYHLQALRLFETLNNLRGQSFCLHSLGNDFFFLKQFTTAREYYKRSLSIKEKLDDKRGALNTTISLGDVYKDLNEFKKAEEYYQWAITESKRMKLPAEEARILHQNGLLYRKMKEHQKARDSFSKSMVLSKQMGDSITFIKTKSELRDLELAEQNKNKTESQMLDGLNTLIRIGDKQQAAIEYHRLSEYYSLNKDFEKALYYLQKHEALADSVEGKAVLIQMKELEEKYNSEKQKREIELLKKDQELQNLELQRQRANTTLIIIALISVVVIGTLLLNRYRVMNRIKRQLALEQMRQTISRDLHDDIGSALSSINILSKVAQEEKDNTQNYLQRISDQSAKMMETMGDMVWSINPQNDSLEQVIVRMREFATEILDAQNIALEFTDNIPINLVLDAEKRKNLFLIFKEVINNAAKYSQATQVKVSLAKINNDVHLHISDNGKGFDETTVRAGNGLRNLRERATEIGGTLMIKSESGKGTAVDLQMHLG